VSRAHNQATHDKVSSSAQQARLKLTRADRCDNNHFSHWIGFFFPTWTKRLGSNFSRLPRASRTLLIPINRPLIHPLREMHNT
jgi:hypothetical protein